MRNCFPPPLKPESWKPEGSVEDEYEEYTLDEIINGKVYFFSFPICCVFDSAITSEREYAWSVEAHLCIP